jgi:hypothetical protein
VFLIDPYRFAPAYDTDAQTYITAVETADGQALETAVKDAINTFVVGCKADSIWTAIKASCILAGARTLAGALVPLVGTAPTNVNFVSGDYNRKNGLTGNRTTKYINSNRASNASLQNDLHFCVYLTNAGTTNLDRAHIGTTYTGANADLNDITALADGRLIARSRNPSTLAGDNLFSSPAGASVGFIGHSRTGVNTYLSRYGNSSYAGSTYSSYTPGSSSFEVFRAKISPDTYSNATISFYSIGNFLNLALLDTRVTALINAISAAIP